MKTIEFKQLLEENFNYLRITLGLSVNCMYQWQRGETAPNKNRREQIKSLFPGITIIF